MRTNSRASAVLEYTHEGAIAAKINKTQKLRRLVMASMLWEDSFYVDGIAHSEYVKQALLEASPEEVAEIAIETREKMKLRHMPLFLVRELARHPNKEARKFVSATLARVIQRPDELAEFLSIYWKDGKQPLSAQVKKGLAAAFQKFNEYEFAKWQKDDSAVKLRDVLFLTHSNPSGKEELYKKIVDRTLEVPDTWEVSLSAGADKKETFERLLSENKLGALALLRNLRNMQQSGVDESLIKSGLANMKVERVLPFRFISAAKYAPSLEPQLEDAMFRCLEKQPKLSGKTVLCVDTSGSMQSPVSGRSEISRQEAAVALAILLREICEDCQIIAFGSTAGFVRPRRGFALQDEIGNGKFGHGTDTQQAALLAASKGYDRLIILTDEQSATSVGNPLIGSKGYMLNVASYQNGVGGKDWVRIDGWSESVVDYIQEIERN
jgi:hypothetical protein